MKALRVVGLLVLLVVCSACNTTRQVLGIVGPGEPTIDLKSAETRWLLIKNPRFGDVRSEPEYIWVEEDKVPTTVKSFVFGESTLLAPPDIVSKYGPPPGGGRISPRQGGAYKVENVNPPAPASRSAAATVPGATRTDAASAITVPPATRGYVVFVDTSRVVIDLAAADGVKLGTNVSVRRDKIAIVHPITGEMLGELDEEVATGRVIEVRDKFSIVEVQKAAAGVQVQVKDRVVLR